MSNNRQAFYLYSEPIDCQTVDVAYHAKIRSCTITKKNTEQI